VQRAFGTLTCSNPLGALVKLRRTGTVEEYKVQFLPMLARCWPLQEHDQIDIFTAGLRNPMQMDVELQHPATLDDAMGLRRPSSAAWTWMTWTFLCPAPASRSGRSCHQ
jgi:hypothetical protein